jgi:hypothetical protein
MKVIGVASQIANGKDVLCDYLVKALNKKYDQITIDEYRAAAKTIEQLYVESKLNSTTDQDIIAHAAQYRKNKNRWERSAFANAVKEVFETSFGVTREFTENWKRNPESPPGMLQSVRKSLQFIGDGFRQIKSDIWIEIALRDESKNKIFSDGRYINEAAAIKARGGIMIVLYRPGFLNDDPNSSEAQIRPIIEFCGKYLEEGPIPSDLALKYGAEVPTGIQHYDYFIKNDGSIEDLYDKVDKKLVPFIESIQLQ